jgi:hypothetical protein
MLSLARWPTTFVEPDKIQYGDLFAVPGLRLLAMKVSFVPWDMALVLADYRESSAEPVPRLERFDDLALAWSWLRVVSTPLAIEPLEMTASAILGLADGPDQFDGGLRIGKADQAPAILVNGGVNKWLFDLTTGRPVQGPLPSHLDGWRLVWRPTDHEVVELCRFPTRTPKN